MIYLLYTLHVSVCLFLMLVILLQAGKGGGVGAAFGSATSQQVFGGRGAGTFLERLTTVTAIIFMVTSMTLTYVNSQSDNAKLQKAAVGKRRQAEQDAKKKAQELLKAEVEKKAKTAAEEAEKKAAETPAAPAPAPESGTPAAPAQDRAAPAAGRAVPAAPATGSTPKPPAPPAK